MAEGNTDPLDLGEFAKIQGNSPMVDAESATINARLPDYWERFLEPKWHDDSGKELSVYGAMAQELAWIRRVVIHGEDARAELMRRDEENVIRHAETTTSHGAIAMKAQRYVQLRWILGIIQIAIFAAILWRVW
jgi:hypothetical protein